MRGMASRAPLVLAAALFVLGIAGLAQTVRQTGTGATPAPLTELVIRPLAPPDTTSTAATADAVSDAPSPNPNTAPTEPVKTIYVPATQAAAPAATEEPTPESHGGAIAAGVASDGGETVPATATPLVPLRFGMIGRDNAAETPEATATPAKPSEETGEEAETPAP